MVNNVHTNTLSSPDNLQTCEYEVAVDHDQLTREVTCSVVYSDLRGQSETSDTLTIVTQSKCFYLLYSPLLKESECCFNGIT